MSTLPAIVLLTDGMPNCNANNPVTTGNPAPVGMIDQEGLRKLVAQGDWDAIEKAREQGRIDFIELEPLHQDAARIQVAPDALVELAREQARDAAHPGIGGLRDDDVVAPLAG